MTTTTVGTVGGRDHVDVDERGRLRPDRSDWTLEWWIGADDRWRFPAGEVSVRQSLVDATPVVRTAVRVPGGDAVQHVYGAAPGTTVIDVANESPAPFVLAVVVRGAHRVAAVGATVTVDDQTVLSLPRPPARWAASTDATTEAVVAAGDATAEPFRALHDRTGRLDAAFLFPVAHRTRRRFALAAAGPVELGRLPDPADAARGWRAHLDRGMRVELPDPGLADAVHAARAEVLLAASRRPLTPDVVAALEDWGFDAEAADAWAALGWRARRHAGRRAPGPTPWSGVMAARTAGAPSDLLLSVRGLLAHEAADGTVALLGELPPGWRGAPVEVHDAPTRRGRLSYAVRWHGDRPAVLWAAPPGVPLRAPGLDPTWTTTQASGEALLGARAA